MTQRQALELMKTGANVFVTGAAGSGKTHVIKQYIAYLRSHHIPVAITASTGIAATHIGGVTIHSWAGIGVKNDLTEEDLNDIGQRAYIRKKIEESKVLIIDEISMLHHFRLDMVDMVLKHIKKSEAPFGGMQLILCGDFFQLPPVSRFGERDVLFAFESEAWGKAKISVCYLEENFRHNDDPVAGILNEIRSGEVSDGARETLKERYKASSVTTEELGVEPTRLFTHNIDVDRVNDVELSKVESNECVYEMSAKGKKHLVEGLKKSCLAPDALRLRKGARVMCVKNNPEKGYVNGTLGVVVSCGFDVDPIIRTAGSTEYPEGRLITIDRAIWVIDDKGKSLAEIHQYPLRLAWAITVHKSQGMSLDAVEVDLSKCFEPGMGYVALSRVRSLAGLSILGMNESAFAIHPDVFVFDTKAKEYSSRAESVLMHTSQDELERAQKQFLAMSAPLHKIGKKKSYEAKGLEKPKKEKKKSRFSSFTKRPFRRYTKNSQTVE